MTKLLALALVATFSAAACAQPVAQEAEGTTTQKLLAPVKTPRITGGRTLDGGHAGHGTPATRRAKGAKLTHRAQTAARTGVLRAGRAMPTVSAAVPESVDLSQWAPAAVDQGNTGACGTYSIGYATMGWWAAKQGLAGAPFAPMFLYAQQVRGNCEDGTGLEDNLSILEQSGIPSAQYYEPMQQELDCQTQPGQLAFADAAQTKVTGAQSLDLTDVGASIRQALAAGFPVVIGMETFNELDNVTSDDFVVDAPTSDEESEGGHAVALFAYDRNGVWFLNSWGADWGYNGWAMLTWAFIDGSTSAGPNVDDAVVITSVQ